MTTNFHPGVNGTPSTISPSVPNPAPSQRPRLWIMWANVALSWSGLALLYLMFLTFRNIRWARRNSQPWFRYATPLATLASAIVVLGILGSLITSSDLRNPAQATPLGSSNSANEPAVAPVGPVQPQGDTPEEIIRAVEEYRIQAFATGNSALLTKYFAVGNNKENDQLYQHTVNKVNLVIPENKVGHVKMSVTKIVIVSATPVKIVANVSVHDAIDGTVIEDFTYNWRVYEVVNARWLMTYARTMT